MKKINYSKPTMKIVQLKHRQQLLVVSGTHGSRQSYGEATEQTWE